MSANQLERTLTDGEIRQLPLKALKLGRDGSTVLNIGNTADLPGSVPGYSTGALFLDVQAGNLYINTGTALAANFQAVSAYTNIPRSSLATEVKPYTIPATSYRVHDALHTNLSNSPSGTNLGLITGTFGTHVPYLRTSNAASSNVFQRAAFIFTLPAEYVAGGSVQVRLGCGMLGAAADTSATVDVEVYNISGFSNTPPVNLGSDLCLTPPANINSLNFANQVFNLNATGLVPGSSLLVRVTIEIDDTTSGGTITGNINQTIVDCSVKG
jgi:hypothetical protein